MARKTRFHRAARLAFATAVIAIALFSLSPTLTPGNVGLPDKLAHFVAYALAVVLANLGFRGRRERLIAAFALVAFAGLLEVSQAYVPGRSAGVVDFAMSSLGVALGMILSWLQRRIAL